MDGDFQAGLLLQQIVRNLPKCGHVLRNGRPMDSPPRGRYPRQCRPVESRRLGRFHSDAVTVASAPSRRKGGSFMSARACPLRESRPRVQQSLDTHLTKHYRRGTEARRDLDADIPVQLELGTDYRDAIRDGADHGKRQPAVQQSRRAEAIRTIIRRRRTGAEPGGAASRTPDHADGPPAHRRRLFVCAGLCALCSP